MTSDLGALAPALACYASAILVMPLPTAHRRFRGLFRRAEYARKLGSKWMIRATPLLGAPLVFLTGPGPVVAAVLVAATLAARRRRARRERLQAADSAQLIEGLESVIGELRIGAHPSAAAQVAAQETTGEVARAFAVSAARSRLGGSGAEGLRRPGAAVAGELARVAAAWQVAERHGLALAELLTAARLDLLGRKRFRDRTRAALAGARATAAVLALLPLLGIGLGELMGASPLDVLFRSAAGTVLLPLGSALTCAGLLWADAITDKVLR
ncbi:type II secretion system F family protein [Nocardia sp. JMUB6875]|uniref:type II secretion system F family protein n=1 Tax=Nocardia sp. JMUB6875 TaxID=3158170 RepID=UPI0032E7E51D